MKILRISFFQPDAWGDGGAKRTSQIGESIAQAGLEEEIIDFNNLYKEALQEMEFSNFQALKVGYAIVKKCALVSFLRRKRPYRFLVNFGLSYLVTKAILERYTFDLLVLENTRPDVWYLPYFFHYLKLDFVALPHNVESLVPSQRSPLSHTGAPVWLNEEIDRLAFAKSIFTISREEAWLLKLHNIDASFFPYWPADEVYQDLLAIRKDREQNDKSGALVIGSAGNPPTYQGMHQIIEYFTHNKPKQVISIAGFRTDKVFQHMDLSKADGVNLLGPLSKSELRESLCSVKCVIINQAISSGALTKIVEFLIAGIPLIVNVDSTRSYTNMKGVYTFYRLDQINDYLSRKLPMPPLPVYSDEETDAFVNYLKVKKLVDLPSFERS